MFTGIIQGMAKVLSIEEKKPFSHPRHSVARGYAGGARTRELGGE
ncbi:Uncharacterised protein [Raoultella terrigena]|uniref:Uncharacterized protein n=1 Tax=Raoultella terrigena TaxID=577 RepID=A0A3P8IYF6_RAOTE|nr:Uncharacterised protein [Raoultella terrigena]